MSKRISKVEFGDFQTPQPLAGAISELLLQRGVKPASIVEPNCGTGSFVIACLERFEGIARLIATDINPKHVDFLRSSLRDRPRSMHVELFQGDFYETCWPKILNGLPEPLLVIGNPPWVTNAGLGVIGGSNLPEKSNFQGHAGLDALTGKSNFDISEWMMIRESEWLNGRTGTLAMLCKKAVARKVLLRAWKNSMQVSRSDIYSIDAKDHFNASVESCLLVCDFSPRSHSKECVVHSALSHDTSGARFGFRDGRLVADVAAYEHLKRFSAKSETRKWRSGIKHDCAEVMELEKEGTTYRNGLGQHIELEQEYLYPMLKSSQLANGCEIRTDRWMLVTQRHIGDNSGDIKQRAPKTWRYLQANAERLDRRASVIYRGRPPFSMFGVGEYTFAPWKVAISGLYKKLEFKTIGPMHGKPVVFDDTCYFLACKDQKEAYALAKVLESPPAKEFYNSLIFWDAKRPLTAEILNSLDVDAVALEIGVASGDFQPNRSAGSQQVLPRLFSDSR